MQAPDLKKTADDSRKPFPAEDRKPEKISAERNLEKWPAIWQPAKANAKLEVRYLERDLTLADGRQVHAKVKVGFTDEGMLTTEDQKTYYALVKHWHDNDRTDEVIPFSIRKLAKILRKKGWGTNVIDSITESLSRLRVTPFTWTNAYIDGSTSELVEEADRFNILADLKIIRRKKDGHVTYEAGYYRFNDFITKNLLSRHTKPVLFDTILNFKSPIAQLLYTHVDLMLYGKSQYERRTLELFDELGLKGKAYKNLSNRKQKLIPALKELAGVRVTSGWIGEATLERTKDGKDYKTVFRKISVDALVEDIRKNIEGLTNDDALTHLEKEEQRLIAEFPNLSAVIRPQLAGLRNKITGGMQIEEPSSDSYEVELDSNPEPATGNNPIAGLADELVRYFHKLFHGVENHSSQSKELGQAVSLIASLGFEKARYVVDFSRRAAEETNYKPQTFGGIVQYTSRAIEQYEQVYLSKERSQQRQVRRDEYAGLEAAYDSYLSTAIDQFLTDPNQQAEVTSIIEHERTVLRSQFPLWPDDRRDTLAQHAVRAEIRKRLQLLSFDEFVSQEVERDGALLDRSAQLAKGVDGEVKTHSPDTK